MANASIPDEARAAAAAGRVVEAVKITRRQTGLGLMEAKDAVDAFLRGDAAEARGAHDADIPSDAIASLYEGKLIHAIKLTRVKTGLGLKDAKEAVERHLASNPSTNQRFRAAAAEQRRAALNKLVWLLALTGLAVLGYLWLAERAVV